MGTWSITPNNGLASIDANSGVATFREHTSDVTYTIHFSDSTCTGGEVTKTFMVFACSQPTCVCSTFSAATSGTRVPSTTSSTEYIVGRYTAATNCSDSISISHRSGTDFLTGLRASGGNIYAKVAVANTGSERSSTYFVRQGSCEDYFTAYQSSGGTPPTPTPCTCTATPVTTKLPSITATSVTVGSYERSGDCSGAYSVSFVTGSGTDFLGSFNFSSGVITANVTSANPTTSTRSGTYRIYRGDTLCSSNFTVTQAASTPTCTTCNDANIQGLSGGATAEGGTNVLIGSFSYSCDPGLTAKRVSGGDFITNMTVNNGNVYGTVAANTETTPRTEDIGIYVGTSKCAQYTLTQQGATPVACTCTNANVQVGTTAITLGYTAGSTAETTYSHDCTVYINNNQAGGWLDVNSTNGKLEFNSTSQATSTRSANVYIDDVNGNHCKTINVTQEGPVHTYSFKFKYYDYEEGPMVTGDYNRYTGYDVTDFKIDGQPATMQVEVYYRRSFYDKSVQNCTPSSAQNYTGGTSASSVQTYDEGTEWCGGAVIHVNGFKVYYNGALIKQMQGQDSELDGTYEGELP